MMTTNGYFRFQLGEFACLCLSDGSHDYPMQTFFTNAPEAELKAALHQYNLPTDYITTPYTNLVVDTDDRRVLVDLGAGALAPRTGKLLQNMHAAGIPPNSIDSVLITHAHPDHIGGMLNDSGTLNYPNAAYYISKVEWDFWFSEHALQKAPEMFVTIARNSLKPVQERVHLIEQDQEIIPGIHTILAAGHTPGHMVIAFCSGNQYLLYTSDTVLHPLHLEHPDWLPIYDLLPEQAAASKHTVFNLAAERRALVIGQHFHPFPSLGHVIRKGNGWHWLPVADIEN